ncbi:MAG TPA: TetR/AcrR family transcriptional regulator [Anaerolineales bacterium]|jgi:AcrR family transcriptional regulator
MANKTAIQANLPTSDRVLQAAFELFISQGYHGTSMRQVAKAARLTPASIYNHFASKEEIFKQVLIRYHPYREMMANLEVAQGDTVDALIKDAAQRVISVVRSRRDLQHLIFIEIVEFKGEHASEMFSRAFPDIQKFLAKLQNAKGKLRPIPPENLILTLMGLMMSQWMLEGLLSGNTVIPLKADQFETAIDIYLHGILDSKEQSL